MNSEPLNEQSAGQLLRQAREQRKLTIQQVALQLNLKADQVERLEQDRLDGSMLETFARGYIRAYGRLLKLPEADLMAAFNRQTGSAVPQTKPMRTFSNRTARQATENRFMWLTYAIIVLLLVLLFVWWWQTARDTTDSTAPAQQHNPVQQEPVQTEPVLPLPAEAEENVLSSELTDSVEAERQLSAMLQQLLPPVEEDVLQTVMPSMDTLEMRFSENCWVDVVDAEGSRVAYGTKRAGYVMQLTGTAPFVVTLGNPSVVQINFNQQAVDMSSFPGGRVAKFTIPESE